MNQFLQRSPEDRFVDAMGTAFAMYKEEKDREVERWKATCEQQQNRIEGLEAFIRSLGYEVPDMQTLYSSMITAKKSPKDIVFADLIQHPDKEKVLKRLHFLIDGHGGKQVAVILRRTFEEKLITKLPSAKEFSSEFKDVKGKWDSIKKYLSSTVTVDTSNIQILSTQS